LNDYSLTFFRNSEKTNSFNISEIANGGYAIVGIECNNKEYSDFIKIRINKTSDFTNIFDTEETDAGGYISSFYESYNLILILYLIFLTVLVFGFSINSLIALAGLLILFGNITENNSLMALGIASFLILIIIRRSRE